jgi:hypothetical protein
MIYSQRPPLSKAEILKVVPQGAIFQAYLGIYPQKGKFKNPFRADNSPGCFFKQYSDGKIRFVDYAEDKQYDCFDVVQKAKSCSFLNGLLYIEKEIIGNNGITISNTGVIADHKRINKTVYHKLHVATRECNESEFKYWDQYFISRATLKKFDVRALDKAYTNNTLIYNGGSTAYCYKFKPFINKLYFPYRSKGSLRFYHNYPHIMQGHDQLPKTDDLLIITKSLKDVMCFYEMGYNAVAPMAEGYKIKESVLDYYYERFDRVVFIVDHDKTGIKAAERMAEFGCEIAFFDQEKDAKDLSDNIKLNGLPYAKNRIIEMLQWQQ